MPHEHLPDRLPPWAQPAPTTTDERRAQLQTLIEALTPEAVAALCELLRWTVAAWPFPDTPAQSPCLCRLRHGHTHHLRSCPCHWGVQTVTASLHQHWQAEPHARWAVLSTC